MPRTQGVIDLTSSPFRRCAALALGLAALAAAAPAFAQDEEAKPPRRTRVALGPQVNPDFPGSDEIGIGPYVDVSRSRGDKPFSFEAPDQSAGFSFDLGPLTIGPVGDYKGSRTAEDVGALLPEVDDTLEAGGSVHFYLGDNLRVRGEVRKGLGGHNGWIGVASADAVFRDGDQWLFSIGPRLTWSDNRYQDAWFGVAPADAGPSGLAAYNPGGGIQAVGATASFLTQFTRRWGIMTYAKYDRLTGDAGESPIVSQLGSRDQFSGGVALTYTFGRGVD